MTLFNQLSPEAQLIIDENIELVNKHIEEWVKNQRKADSDLPERVIGLLTIVKRRFNPDQRPLQCTPERSSLIIKLIKRGYDMPQFEAVIKFMVPEWWGTKMQRNLTPETLFAASNFTKYLEQAREAYQEKKLQETNNQSQSINNPYEQQFKESTT